MESSVTVNIPIGQEIDFDKSDFKTDEVVKIFFKKKEIKLPTTNKECIPFISDYWYINSFGDVRHIAIPSSPTGLGGKGIILKKQLAEAFLALMQLVKFRDIWNDGWVADWNDTSTKYTILRSTNDSGWGRGEWVRGRMVLSFKSPELRDKFLNTFIELIEEAKPLL